MPLFIIAKIHNFFLEFLSDKFIIFTQFKYTQMTFSFIGAHILRISDYVLTRSTMIYGKLTTGLMLMDFV